MGYTKNHEAWANTDPLDITILDNFETIYDESVIYLTNHNHNDLYYLKSEMEALFWNADNDGVGSESDADLIYKSTGNLHATDLGNASGSNIGSVIMWYNTIQSIPSGWHLCNGYDGTLNLMDRMIIGAGDLYAIGATGGSTTFAPTGSIATADTILTLAQMGKHRHPWNDSQATVLAGHYGGGSYLSSSTEIRDANTVTNYTGGGHGHNHTAAEGSHIDGIASNSLPPYKSLYFIQRLT